MVTGAMKDVRLFVLVSLSDGPKHGYSVQRDIEAFAGARLGPGTLYGAINTLERDGLIEAMPAVDRRRPYRLTSSGRDHLAQQLLTIERIRARTAGFRPA
jgi:DNA-binding PadR family transcriptional regulator